MIGKSLGVYQVEALLGKGGMGSVYRAVDQQLHREVALKVLEHHLADDPKLAARFTREARLLATLNHPNIASVHTLERIDEVQFIVMELVEGKTLEQHLRTRRFALKEALEVSLQVANALDAAQQRGIVHRDLKPSNVMLRDDGHVKVLDFGIAKVFPAAEVEIQSHASTAGFTTTTGGVFGTFPYMSPEQIRGQQVDKRTDIWAFGCILYELFAGQRAFGGDTVSDTIAAILERDPEWSALAPGTPTRIKNLLRRCLRKDPNDRLRDFGDVALVLREVLSATQREPHLSPSREVAGIGATTKGVLVGLALIAAIVVWQLLGGTAPSTPVTRSVLPVPAPYVLALGTHPSLAFSLDGTRLAYVGRRDGNTQMFVHRLDQPRADEILGTGGALSPFFSPDGQEIGFFSTEGDLKTMRLSGGPARSLAQATIMLGASWGPDDAIVYAPSLSSGIWQVPAAGGDPVAVTELGEDESTHRWPQFLPSGESIIYASRSDSWRIVYRALQSNEKHILIEGSSFARYSPTGHLIYVLDGALMAVPFDADRGRIDGVEKLLLQGVATEVSGAAQFALSGNGSLAYVGAESAQVAAVWVDREGTEDPLAMLPRTLFAPRIAPDSGRIAMAVTRSGESDVYLYNIDRDTLELVTAGGNNTMPVWNSANEVTFVRTRGNRYQIVKKPADADADRVLLFEGDHFAYPTSWSPDDRVLAYAEFTEANGYDIWTLIPGEEPRLFLATSNNEWGAVFSPNGEWVAYESDVTGTPEVYVASYPDRRRTVMISSGGGTAPVWTTDGEEMFYQSGQQVMAVRISWDPVFTPGRAQKLFEGPYMPLYDFDDSRERFLMVRDDEQSRAGWIRLVQGWSQEVEAAFEERNGL